ncbi:MAG TPA: hypothetical protein VFN49_02570, partial [Candidatus Aquilonibacter sp.]|nr:hypothetical protein [Candidatus Aquilonibacter sp.]
MHLLAAAGIVIALASPTPPPEPNHVTVDVLQSVLKTSGYEWENAHGYATAASIRYEFQASPKLRFADTLAWQHPSSVYNSPDFPTHPWWFNDVQYRNELDVELGRPDYPLGVGVGFYDYTPVNDFGNIYNLRGFGLGVDRWANYYTFVSPYYSLWYYPDVRGGQVTAGAYGIVRADI